MKAPWGGPDAQETFADSLRTHQDYLRRNLGNASLAAELYALTPGRERPDSGPLVRAVANAFSTPGNIAMMLLGIWAVGGPAVGLAVKLLALGIIIPSQSYTAIAAAIVAGAVTSSRAVLRQTPPRSAASRYLTAEAWLAADVIASSRSAAKFADLREDLLRRTAAWSRAIDATTETPDAGADAQVPERAIQIVALLRTIADEAARRDA